MTSKKLIFLCGFMACGKTTQGKKLAKALAYHFIDLDDYIANKYDKHVADVFKELGEDEFRKVETTSLTECINDNIKTVIALGGGTPCFNSNMELLKKSGLVIYLKTEPLDLYNRILNVKAQRPLVSQKLNTELLQYIENLLSQREQFYSQAQLTINGNNLTEDILKEVVTNWGL